MAIDTNMTPAEWKEAAEELSELKDKMMALAKKCKANISIQGSDFYDGFYITIFNLAEQDHVGEKTYLSYRLTSYNDEKEVNLSLSEFNVKEE